MFHNIQAELNLTNFINLISEPMQCSETECQNGGTCEEHNGKGECICPSGFSGIHCESEIVNCAITECHLENTQNCYNTSGTLQCECVLGYVGQFCDDGIIIFTLDL